MIAKLKHKLTNTEEKKNLATNIFSLGILQAVNYILPLITVPYLVRVLGPEYFGLLAFAAATISYFVLITDYGFNLSATRQISIHRNDPAKVNEIFSSVMIIKTGLLSMSFVLMSLLVFSFEKFSQDWEVYFITFGMVVGQVLFPVWLFQGMERMKYITYLNIGTKSLFTICIFIFVQEQSDYWQVPLLNSLGFIVAGIWSLYLAKRFFGVSFDSQSIRTIKFQLAEGWHVFFASIAISFYTISTTFILGVFASNTVVGYFAAADKIIQAVKGLYAPVSQALYPHVSEKIHRDKQAGLTFIKKTTWIVGIGMFFISLLLFLLAEPVVNLLLGDQYQPSIMLLQIMAFLPFIIALSNMAAVQGLYNLDKSALVSKYVGSVAIFHVSAIYIVGYLFEEIGVVSIMVFTEILITTISIYYFRKAIKNVG